MCWDLLLSQVTLLQCHDDHLHWHTGEQSSGTVMNSRVPMNINEHVYTVDLMHTQTMHMYVYHKMYTCNESYFLMFLECNNHEAHAPTDYHAYATISNRQKQFLWTYVMYVLTSATDSFNIHTSLVWLDPSLSLHISN